MANGIAAERPTRQRAAPHNANIAFFEPVEPRADLEGRRLHSGEPKTAKKKSCGRLAGAQDHSGSLRRVAPPNETRVLAAQEHVSFRAPRRCIA